MTAYRVDQAWPATRVENVEECLAFLMDRQAEGKYCFHGAWSHTWAKIRCMLDVWLENRGVRTDEARFQHEDRLLTDFAAQSSLHLPPGGRMHLELAHVKWGTYRTTATVFVGRHFGLPTRAVDWTDDCWTALFFACRRQLSEDGVVWFMPIQDFDRAIATQWPPLYQKAGAIENDFERDFVARRSVDVLVKLQFPQWMQRPAAQRAFITISGKFDSDHAERVAALGVQRCGRLQIPAHLKGEVIRKLDFLGINGYTLGIGDSTVETIASDLSHELAQST